MSLAYSLGRAIRFLARPGRTPPPQPMPSTSTAPPQSWRMARDDSDGLHIAVTALESHTGLLQQIAESWLMWANLWTHDPATFRANVGYARTIALRLEHDANDLVATVRRLENLRDGVAAFDRRREHAEQLANRAGLLSMALHDRLHELASARGLDAAACVTAAYHTVVLPDAAWIQHRAAPMSESHPLTLKEVLA